MRPRAKTGSRLCLILSFLGALGAAAGICATLPVDPAPNSLIQNPKFPLRQKPPVPFSHTRHERQGVACTTCHHDYKGGRNVWRQGHPVQTCDACHALRPQARRLDLKNAFHRQCKTCHLDRRRQGRAAGPVICMDCHRPT